MIIFENEYNIKDKTIITLGKFDGIHEGHQKLIKTAVDLAREKGYKSLVYTFNQNPKSVLNGEEIQSLMSKSEKIEILEKIGVDYIVFQDFTYEFSKMSAKKFVKEILVDRLNAKTIVVGFNHKFGKGAKGDIHKLKRFGEKMDFSVLMIEPVKSNGEIISSSSIREKVNMQNQKNLA